MLWGVEFCMGSCTLINVMHAVASCHGCMLVHMASGSRLQTDLCRPYGQKATSSPY